MVVEQNNEQLPLDEEVQRELEEIPEPDAETLPFPSFLADYRNVPTESTEIYEEINENEEINNSFWGIQLEDTAYYDVPWISSKAKNNKSQDFPKVQFGNCRLTKKLWSVVYENAPTQALWGPIINETHKETYYSQRVLPWTWLEKYNWLTWRHVAEDWTVRDWDWYIVVACNYLPMHSTIMTTLWPGKVYDRWDMKGKHIDLYVDW